MGLTVVLETERGQRLDAIDDPTNILHRLLPSHDDETYQLLRFIDWYGDTVFNLLQIDTFLKEWSRLRSRAHAPEELELLLRIEKLARRCKDELLYLKFYGD